MKNPLIIIYKDLKDIPIYQYPLYFFVVFVSLVLIVTYLPLAIIVIYLKKSIQKYWCKKC